MSETMKVPEPDLSSLGDIEMAEELARVVDYLEERQTSVLLAGGASVKLMERLARHTATCREMSRCLRSWNSANVGRDAEKAPGGLAVRKSVL